MPTDGPLFCGSEIQQWRQVNQPNGAPQQTMPVLLPENALEFLEAHAEFDLPEFGGLSVFEEGLVPGLLA
jgi:hypothetical protein